MVVINLLAKFRSLTGTFAAAASIFVANPALANSSANADIAAPLRAAQAAKPGQIGGADEQFRQLFSNWQSLEKSDAPALAAVANAAALAAVSGRTSGTTNLVSAPIRRVFSTTSVSIPSRMPVEGVRLTSDYGMRVHPVLGGRRAHKGIDLAGRSARRSTPPPMASSARPNGSAAMAFTFRSNTAANSRPATATCRA